LLYAGGITASGATAGTYSLETFHGPITAFTAGDLTHDGATDLLVNHSNLFVTGGDATTLRLRRTFGLAAGHSSAFGDFNNDGYGGIVVGAVGGPVSPTDPSWTVRADAVFTFTQGSPGVPGDNAPGDGFGDALSIGDLNGDGYDDLAIGVPGKDTSTATPDAGDILIMFGSSNGLSFIFQIFDQDTDGVPDTSETGDSFGSQLRLADLTGDGRADLTVAATGEDDGDGAVTVLPSSDIGASITGARILTTASFDLPGKGQPHLGSALG
jgi:hypothetical protein